MAKAAAILGLLLEPAVGLRRSASKAPTLCDEHSVMATCAKLGGKISVTISDVADALGVGAESAAAFLQRLDISSEEVSCEDICQKTVSSLPAALMPPSPDVGCYMKGSQKVCDVDLSETTLTAMAQESRAQRSEPRIMKEPLSAPEAEAMAVALESMNNLSFEDMQVQMANWFSIWPMTGGDLAAQSTGGARNQKEIDAQTKAQLSTCLQRLGAGRIDDKVKKWFGSSNSATKRVVRGGLQHLQNVVKNVHYINHPNERGYYGWVYSPYRQAKNGTWPIHLGGAYFSSGTPDRIGTITHEASHFYPLGTDDHMYCDVAGCLRMAQREPAKAKSNADHFSFFIDDVVGGGMR